jgi:hypothetical protein
VKTVTMHGDAAFFLGNAELVSNPKWLRGKGIDIAQRASSPGASSSSLSGASWSGKGSAAGRALGIFHCVMLWQKVSPKSGNLQTLCGNILGGAFEWSSIVRRQTFGTPLQRFGVARWLAGWVSPRPRQWDLNTQPNAWQGSTRWYGCSRRWSGREGVRRFAGQATMGGLELLKQARGGGAAPSPTPTAALERRGVAQAEPTNWCASPEAEGGGEAAAADVAVSGRPSEETHVVPHYVLCLLPTSRLHVNVDLRSTTLPSSCPQGDPPSSVVVHTCPSIRKQKAE